MRPYRIFLDSDPDELGAPNLDPQLPLLPQLRQLQGLRKPLPEHLSILIRSERRDLVGNETLSELGLLGAARLNLVTVERPPVEIKLDGQPVGSIRLDPAQPLLGQLRATQGLSKPLPDQLMIALDNRSQPLTAEATLANLGLTEARSIMLLQVLQPEHKILLGPDELKVLRLEPKEPLLKQLQADEVVRAKLPEQINIIVSGQPRRLEADDTLVSLGLAPDQPVKLVQVKDSWVFLGLTAPMLIAIAALLLLGIAVPVSIALMPTPTPGGPVADGSGTPASATPETPTSAPSAIVPPTMVGATDIPTLTVTAQVTPTLAPTPSAIVFQIAVVKPGGITYGDRARGIEKAAEYAEEALASGPLYDQITAPLAALGVELRVTVTTDESKPEVARAVAETLVDDNMTRCVVGHYNSSSSIAAGEVYSRTEMLTLPYASTNEQVTIDNPYAWRLVSTDAQQGPKAYELARLVFEALDRSGQTVIVRSSSEDDAYTQGVMRKFREAAGVMNADGVPVNPVPGAAGLNLNPDPAQDALFVRNVDEFPNLTAAIATIEGLGEVPGLIFFIGTEGELTVFLEQLNALGAGYASVPIIGVSLMDDINTINDLRLEYENHISYTALAVAPGAQLNGNPLMSAWFIERYKEENERKPLPSAYAAEAYDGVYICARAILKAVQEVSSRAEKPLAELIPADVSGVMASLVSGTDFPRSADAFSATVVGPYTFSNATRGELEASLLIVQQDGAAAKAYVCTPNCPPIRLEP